MSDDSKRPPHGASDGIRRRDFLNGVLLAAGGAAVQSFFPHKAFAQSACTPVDPNTDPRVLRGGNAPATFNVAHWMRDHRLTFGASSVTVAPGRFDTFSGTFAVDDSEGAYDVIVVGSGLSGLAATFFLTQQRPGVRVLLLDANASPGGNAGRDADAPLPGPVSTGAAYCVTPYEDFLTQFYAGIGVVPEQHYLPGPFYSYFFDDRAPYARPGSRGWTVDTYGQGLRDMPYAPNILQDIQQSKQDFRNWYSRHGSPTDPADHADPRYDYLSQITLADYFASRGYHPAVTDYYDRYAVDALAGKCSQVNAFTSISFLGAEFFDIFALPGGNGGVTQLATSALIAGAVDGATADERLFNPIRADRLDAAGNRVRMRQRSVAVRVDTSASQASVTYWQGGVFKRARAKAVIVAGQSHSARHLVEHLSSAEARAAWDQFTQVPVVVANVALRSAAPLVDLGLGYDQYWWGSRYWADFTVSDWATPRRHDRDRATTLTFFGGNTLPPEEMPAERARLLTTPFCDYEQSLRDDLERVLAGAPGGFDFDRDVTAVFIYRWGHGMIYPKLGFPFGAPVNANGQAVRTPSPRHIARQQIGRISFAGQDTESSPAIESAIFSGLRTANEVLPLL